VRDIEFISLGITTYLLGLGFIISWAGKRATASHQHEFAFATIFLLFLATIPQFNSAQVAPGIILILGLMLIVLHFSAYYSGTPKISARLYALILFIAAIMFAQLAHTIFLEQSLSRMFLMGGVWLLLQAFEKIFSACPGSRSRVENAFLGLWILTACLSLLESRIHVLPDLFFYDGVDPGRAFFDVPVHISRRF